MTKYTKERLNKIKEAMIEVAENYGFRYNKKYYLISIWDMASNLNNGWKAYLFVSSKHRDRNRYYYFNKKDGHWAVESYNLYRFLTPLETSMKLLKWKIIRQKSSQGWQEFLLIPRSKKSEGEE